MHFNVEFCFVFCVSVVCDLKRVSNSCVVLFSVSSCFGFLLLKKEEFKRTKFISTPSGMRRAIDSPMLEYYRLLAPGAMIGYFKKECIRYDVPLPLGGAVLLQSKFLIVKDYYFSILPRIGASNLKCQMIYQDTASDRSCCCCG